MPTLTRPEQVPMPLEYAAAAGYDLLDKWQVRVLTSDARKQHLTCCRQSGKSTVTALVAGLGVGTQLASRSAEGGSRDSRPPRFRHAGSERRSRHRAFECDKAHFVPPTLSSAALPRCERTSPLVTS